MTEIVLKVLPKYPKLLAVLMGIHSPCIEVSMLLKGSNEVYTNWVPIKQCFDIELLETLQIMLTYLQLVFASSFRDYYLYVQSAVW